MTSALCCSGTSEGSADDRSDAGSDFLADDAVKYVYDRRWIYRPGCCLLPHTCSAGKGGPLSGIEKELTGMP